MSRDTSNYGLGALVAGISEAWRKATPAQKLAQAGLAAGLVGGTIYLLTGSGKKRPPPSDLPAEPVERGVPPKETRR